MASCKVTSCKALIWSLPLVLLLGCPAQALEPDAQRGLTFVSANCTECHAYHNGDHAQQGVGAARRNPKKQLAIDEFLLGK